MLVFTVVSVYVSLTTNEFGKVGAKADTGDPFGGQVQRLPPVMEMGP